MLHFAAVQRAHLCMEATLPRRNGQEDEVVSLQLQRVVAFDMGQAQKWRLLPQHLCRNTGTSSRLSSIGS